MNLKSVTAAKAYAYDMVFRNAEIYDGSGNESFVADVGIKNGKITAVGTDLELGRAEKDCRGLCLAPGFVDVHTHSDYQMFVDQCRLCKLMQGVTFEIGGQCGWSRGVVTEDIERVSYDYLQAANNDGRPLRLYTTYDEMLEDMQRVCPGTHQLTFVGHHLLRADAVGVENRAPTPAELQKMKDLLAQALRDGAPGFSTGLVYAPGCYAETEELIELAKVCASYGGIYTTHMRDEADRLLDSVREVIRIAKESGVRVNISHFKVMYRHNLPQLEQAIRLIEQANSEGCDIFFDFYPYEACSATLLSTLPPSYLSRGIDWLVDELSTAEGIRRLENAILHPTERWENPLLNAGFDKDMIAVAENTPDAEGKTIREYALQKGMTDTEAYAYIIRENRGVVTDIRFTMFEDSLKTLCRHPLSMIGTDGLYSGEGKMTHPRGFGSFPRYLGRLVRDKGFLPLCEAVRRITGLPADTYRLKDKGYIRVGYDADLVLFDKNTVIDGATYTDPFVPNRGIEAVFVLGQAAVVNNIPTGVYNGRMYKANR